MLEKISGSSSKIFIASLVLFVAGVGVHSIFSTSIISTIGIIIALVVLVVAMVLLWRHKIIRTVLLLGLFFVLGVFRFDLGARAVFNENGAAGFTGKIVSLRGVITALPEHQGRSTSYRISIENILQERQWQKISGKILVYAPRYPEFEYGDRVAFTCELKKEEDAKKRGWYASRGASAVCSVREAFELVDKNAGDPMLGILLHGRANILKTLQLKLPEPQSGLLAGLLVGERAGLSDDLSESLRRTGTTHIIAISGFNIAMITSILFAVLAYFIRRKGAFWVTIGFLIAFVFFVGAGASVVRAAIMGGIVLVARYMGRTGNGFRLLVLAAAIMLAVNPWLLVFDLGFVLSFAATVGLLIFAHPLSDLLTFIPKDFRLRETLSETLAATFATLPFTVSTFGIISFIAPLANLLVLILVPVATWIGVFFILFSKVPLLGVFFGWISWVFLTAIIGFIEFFGSLNFAAVEVGGIPFIFSAIMFVAVVAAGFAVYQNTKARPPVKL